MLPFFLSSGLFLGWSLGANDAANVFGTAVGSRMLRFRTAAILCGAFVILGSIAGAGPADTLDSLGSVNAIGGAFTVALSAAVTVYWMTRMGLPVSSTQSIVGAIIGWNLFVHAPTNSTVLTKIMGTWIVCPLISGVFSALLYIVVRRFVHRSGIHLLRQDQLTRYGLILVGAFGSYSLGANNIGAVVGVFVPSNPFQQFTLPLIGTIPGQMILFAVGGIAIATGVFTYSRKVMETVGSSLMKLSPLAALIVVLSQSLVLFLFASKGLESWLSGMGLPTIPLVPVSSSQAVVGAVLGIAVVKRARNLRFRMLGTIALGWVATPLMAGILAFISLFFMQNVFDQAVQSPKHLSRMEHRTATDLLSPDIRRIPICSNTDVNISDGVIGFTRKAPVPTCTARLLVSPSPEPETASQAMGPTFAVERIQCTGLAPPVADMWKVWATTSFAS